MITSPAIHDALAFLLDNALLVTAISTVKADPNDIFGKLGV